MATKRPKRTHLVRHNIIHDGVSYKSGDTITFGPEVPDEQIHTLLNMGYLDGKLADKLDRERERHEEDWGIAGMSDEENEKLWRQFLTMTPEQRRELAQRDARTKTDADAARIANISETPQRAAPVDAEPVVDDAEDDEGADAS